MPSIVGHRSDAIASPTKESPNFSPDHHPHTFSIPQKPSLDTESLLIMNNEDRNFRPVFHGAEAEQTARSCANYALRPETDTRHLSTDQTLQVSYNEAISSASLERFWNPAILTGYPAPPPKRRRLPSPINTSWHCELRKPSCETLDSIPSLESHMTTLEPDSRPPTGDTGYVTPTGFPPHNVPPAHPSWSQIVKAAPPASARTKPRNGHHQRSARNSISNISNPSATSPLGTSFFNPDSMPFVTSQTHYGNRPTHLQHHAAQNFSSSAPFPGQPTMHQAFPSPPTTTNPPPIIHNSRGERLDPPIPHDRTAVQRVKELKLCNVYYLRGSCSKGGCTHRHDYTPNAEEMRCLTIVARMAPCNRGTACDAPACIYGHACPAPRGRPGELCAYGAGCRFTWEMHNVSRV